MRVLILSNKMPYPARDGGAIATLNMALGLQRAGAEVFMLAMRTPKHNTSASHIPPSILSCISISQVNVNTTLSAGKAITNLLFSKLPYNALRFVNEEFRLALRELLSSATFDVVQLEGPYLYSYIPTIRQHHKGILSLRAHNVEWEIWERNAATSNSIFKKWYFGVLSRRIFELERRVLAAVDVLVPISNRDAIKLKGMGFSGGIFVSPAGLNIPLQAHQAVEPFSIFHIGGLDWIPNQQGLLWFLRECWGSILRKVPGALLYIAGRNAPGWLVDELSSYPQVTYCGEVDDSSSFMANKKLMIVPLLSGSGMRVKIVEGMAMGKPIVSTSIGAEGVEAEVGRHLLTADDPNLFTNAVAECLCNDALAHRLAEEAYLFARKHFDINYLSKLLYDFYSSAH